MNNNITASSVSKSLPVAAILIENMVFKWSTDQKPLLDIEYFSVAQGEHVFIQGSSGTGKSTLLNILAGILLPLQGTVAINGCLLSNLSNSARDLYRGDHIGFIFQQFNLIPYLSVLDNIVLPARLSHLRAKRCIEQAGSVREQAFSLLRDLELSEQLWDRRVNSLSVGQQQRVACARALLGQPELIIADEPTSALDEDRRKIFLDLLLDHSSKIGATVLFVSHDKTISANFNRKVDLCAINRVCSELNQSKTC